MFELPSTTAHFQRLQQEFDLRLARLYDDAKEVVRHRAEHYDVQRPVWERVSFPHGFLHEVTKKANRTKAQIDRGEECMQPDKWMITREDILDCANYLLFMVAYGDMLSAQLLERSQKLKGGLS